MNSKLDQLTQWFATSRAALWALCALYLVPRALLILLDVQPWSDAAYYYERATELAAGQGYISPEGTPTAFWPPGWPLALAAVFQLGGVSVQMVGLFNLACAALSAWLVLALGRRIGGMERALPDLPPSDLPPSDLPQSDLNGRLALLLLALYPNNAAYVPLALTEVFYTTLLLALCWLLVAGRGIAALLGAGVLLGAASLVKAQTLAVVPLILGIAVLRSPRFWPAVRGAAAKGLVLGLVAALVILPWSVRNERVLGQFVAVSTNGGVTLLTGNNASADGGYGDTDPAYKALFARKAGLDEIAYDAEARKLGMDWIKANPGQFIALMPRKFIKLWGPDGEALWSYEKGAASYTSYAPLYTAVRWANQAWYWLLLAGFGAALVVQVRQRWRAQAPLFDWWLLPYGIAAYPTAICLVFSGQSRFHYPAMPFIALSAAWLLAQLLQRRGAAAT